MENIRRTIFVDIPDIRITNFGPNYFPFPQKLNNTKQKNNGTCKLGVVVIGTNKIFPLLETLSILDKPGVRVMVHIDKKYGQTDIKAKAEKFSNVEFVTNRFNVYWGHSSIVFAQLSSMFELQEKHSCECVVNISDDSFPLLSTDEMIQELERSGNQIWLGYTFTQPKFLNSVDLWRRIYGPPILLSDTSNPPSHSGYIFSILKLGTDLRTFSYPLDNTKIKKHDQWVALPRDFVNELRHNPLSLQILAFMEFSCIPDEIYFGAVARELFLDRIVDRATMLVNWKGGFYPKTFTLDDLPQLKQIEYNGHPFLFARKIVRLKQRSKL